MYITVSELANKINNLQRFDFCELHKEQETKITKITVELSSDKTRIDYWIDGKTGDRQHYTEKNIPRYAVDIMNKNTVIYHEKSGNGKELFVYCP